MPSKRGKTTSLALLPFIQPTLTTSGTIFPLQSRHLQLRANILLISRRPITTISSSTQTLTITPSTSVRSLSATTIQLDKHRISFRTPQQATSFVDAVKQAAHPPSRYETLSQIGSGASGVVYLVRRDDGNIFAMKTIPKYDAFYSDNHLTRIIAERVALAQAKESRTPFIVSLIDAFETPTHLCLVTELAALGDLHTFVTQAPQKRLPENVAKSLFSEILLGLEDLHRMGYLYRDMKLNNLLLTRTGHIRLADFGLAKRLQIETVSSSASSSSESDDEEEFRLIGRTKSFVGTRRYMSPEHLVSGHGSNKGYGAPADIWALGVVLYVMLTGKYPFGHKISSGNSAGLFMAIKNDDLQFPEYLSEEVKDLLRGMLDRDWLERFDITQIKGHKWLRGTDWTAIRELAAEDDRMDEILQLAGEEIGTESDEKIEFSDCSDEGCCRKKGSVGQLLGFGFKG